MRAGYLTLFGAILAFSAYQGSMRAPTSHNSSSTTHNPDTSKNSSGPPFPHTDPLPTISAGVCNREIGKVWKDPCNGCGPICPAKDLLDLIEGYFQADADGRPEEEKPTEETKWAWRVPKSEVGNVHFVIAMMPDPVHTHMALFFDRQIEAIEKAAQAQGYLFSRSWMPWDITAHAESTDFTARMAHDDVQQRREDLPGLMIFRKGANEESADTIFVFVVGETPTGGLHAKQFQTALNIQTSIASSLPQIQRPPLLIFGPTFSGSLQSLDTTLVHYDGQFSKILIRSGTVSSFAAAHRFYQTTQKQWARKKTQISACPPDFATFQFSDQYVEFYLSTFFADRHQLHSHVAILSEDETEFGNLEQTQTLDPQSNGDSGSECPKAHGDANARNQLEEPFLQEPPRPLLPFIRLYFPREIAQLRSAYEQDIKVQATPNPGNYVPPQTRLPLSLGVTGNDDDSVPAFAPLQTPISQDAIMQAIVSTLRNMHAKVVIIRASDPLDMVFLARYLRQNYPQARLVTSGADLLMVYDVIDPRFHGILAVTSYPLLNGVEFPASNDHDNQPVQHIFSDSYMAGAFNSFVSLLARDALSTDPDRLPDAPYSQFGLPSFLEGSTHWRPHLWLTTVGRDGYWPVSVLDDFSEQDINSLAYKTSIRMYDRPPLSSTKKPPSTIREVSSGRLVSPSPFRVHFTVGWSILWLITLCFTLLLAFLLMSVHKYSQSEILARFDESSSKSRNHLLFLGCVLALLLQSLFVFPVVVWLKTFNDVSAGRHWPFLLRSFVELFSGMWLVWWMYLLSAAALARSSRKRLTKTGFGNLGSFGFWIFAVLIAVTAGLTLFIPWERLGSDFHSFIYRYLDVGSGVSPLLPIAFALAAWTWWWWQSLTAVVSTETKSVILPAPSAFDEMSGDPEWKYVLQDPYDRVRLKHLTSEEGQWPWNALKAIPLRTRAITILAIASEVTIFLLMRPGEIAEAFEPVVYRDLYWLLLYSCLFLICYVSSHIVVLWLQLRKLLRAIEALPFRRGFSDVRNLTWKPLWKLAGAGRQQFTQVFRQEIAALSDIQQLDPECPLLRGAVARALKQVQDVSGEYEKFELDQKVGGRLGTMFHDFQQEMAGVTASALIYANEKSKEETYSPPDDSDAAKDDKSISFEPPASDNTLRAVEHFLCLFYLNVILVPLRRLQTLILALAGVFVFVLLSYSSYPFESRESFHALLISILFAISLVVGIVYGQMYSDPLLSRITNTKPGELGLDFWVKLGTFVFIPVLSLLSVQFPEVNSFLFSWLQPALQSIK